MRKWVRRLVATVAVTALGALALPTTGFAANSKTPIIVGSKSFTESKVVSEIYALALKKAGYKVTRKQNISNSVVFKAVQTGQIDVYPEYTGTIVDAYLNQSTTNKNAKQIVAAAKEGVAKYKLTTLTPAPGNDSQGIAVTTKVAKKYGLYTISDLQKKANKIRFVSQGEFDQRADALPGMVKKYGKFDFKSSKDYDDSLKYKILSEGKGDAAPVSTTDGQLANGNKYTLLKDDKHLWPAYNLVPLVRNSTLKSHPKMAKTLNQVDKKLTTKTLTELNKKVDVDGQNYQTVAKNWFNKNIN